MKQTTVETEAARDGRVMSGGGFTDDTEVVTTDGPVCMANLSAGDRIYALSPSARLAKPKRLVEVRQVPFEGQLITISGKRVALRVHPSHRILYSTKARPDPRFTTARQLPTQEYYRFVNEWTTSTGRRLDKVDITDLVTEFEARAVTQDHGHTFRAALPESCEPSANNSHTGYYFDAETFNRYQSRIESVADEVTIRQGWKQQTTPYLFDGDDFIEFIGWFVTEGSVYRPEGKRTALIQIAQETEQHRRRIAALFDRMGLEVTVKERAFSFGSAVFGTILDALCGTSSRSKHLPAFVWQLTTTQQRLLLDTLIRGDGNDMGVYYTASEQLAREVMRLAVEVGVKPRYTCRDGIWRLYHSQGHDGFRASKNVSTAAADTALYRLTVEDYDTVLAGRNGRFQWVGVSGVS